MYCFIYKIENYKNGKVYIGQTWKPIVTRFSQHQYESTNCVKLQRAIKKYGIMEFGISILLVTHTQVLADAWEIHFITKYDSVNNGYNIKSGGSRGTLPPESRQKISEASKHQTNRWKWPKGKPRSEADKLKISNAELGKKLSPETIEKMSKAHTGRKWSLVNSKRVYQPCHKIGTL